MAGEPTFVPAQNPSYPVRRRKRPRVRETTFGDGYSSRERDGINFNREALSLSWENLTETEANQIFDFLEARGGDEAFLYQPPTFSSALKWICTDYDMELSEFDVYMLNASLVQVFDP